MNTAQDVQLLVVEDSESDALLLVREVRRGGFNPIWERVENAEGFNRAMVRGHWDLIIADESLPQFNGFTALAMARGQLPHVPFILVSGRMTEEIAAAALEAGACDCVTKGKWARLVPAIRRELRVARERREIRAREAELRLERSKLAAVIDSAQCPILVCDDRLKIMLINPSMESLLGTGMLDSLGCPLFEFVQDPSMTDLEGMLLTLSGAVNGSLGEWVLKSRTRGCVSVQASLSLTTIGSRPHFTFVFQETAQRNSAVAALVAREAQYRQVAREAPVAIYLTNSAGECVFANRRWCELVGRPEDQVKGRDWADALHPEDRERFIQEWQDAVRRDLDFATEYRLTTPNGKVTWLTGRSIVLRNDKGEVTGHLGTAIDLS